MLSSDKLHSLSSKWVRTEPKIGKRVSAALTLARKRSTVVSDIRQFTPNVLGINEKFSAASER